MVAAIKVDDQTTEQLRRVGPFRHSGGGAAKLFVRVVRRMMTAGLVTRQSVCVCKYVPPLFTVCALIAGVAVHTKRRG